ncbi:MAG TPA: hypothetical protein PK595_04415 [Bacteroidota bacterium]|nr:hypothetical protein [Bacteroidota bacterium]
METLIQIVTVVALLSVSALCIYLIVVLLRLKTVLELIQTELNEVSSRLKPLLENLNVASEKVRAIVTKVDDQVTMAHGVFVSMRHIVDNVVYFEDHIIRILEEPFTRVSSVFSNVLSRLSSIFGK